MAINILSILLSIIFTWFLLLSVDLLYNQFLVLSNLQNVVLVCPLPGLGVVINPELDFSHCFIPSVLQPILKIFTIIVPFILFFMINRRFLRNYVKR